MRSVKKREKWGEVNPLTDHFKDTNKKIIIIKHREGEREDLCTQEKERAKKKSQNPRETQQKKRGKKGRKGEEREHSGWTSAGSLREYTKKDRKQQEEKGEEVQRTPMHKAKV